MVSEIKTPDNYQQTDAGIIPQDWKVICLNDCLDLLTDFEANGSFEFIAENVTVYDVENYAWYVRATDLENNSGLSKIRYVDKQTYDFLKKTKLYGGEVLITKRGEIGKVYFFQMKTAFATVAPNMYLLKLNKSVIPFYIYSFFKSEVGNRLLIEKNASSTLGAIYKDDVKSILIPLPPKPEQTSIASALSDVDDLIEYLEKLIIKKQNIKQGAMQELLTGEKRLAGFYEDWEVKKLWEITDFLNGKAHEMFISPTGNYIVVNSKFISTEGEVIKYTDYCLCPVSEGDILMVMSDVPNGRAIAKCFLVEGDNKYTINQRICALKPNRVDSWFLFFKLNRNQYYLSFDDGAKQTNLRKEDVLNCELLIPKSIEEQKAISSIILCMNAEIEILKKKLHKYKMIKQGMFQVLLTGKIRLI